MSVDALVFSLNDSQDRRVTAVRAFCAGETLLGSIVVTQAKPTQPLMNPLALFAANHCSHVCTRDRRNVAASPVRFKTLHTGVDKLLGCMYF